MAWPAIRNFQVYRGPVKNLFVPAQNLYEWIDPTLPPFKTN